jgi:hypothetical protein
MEKIIYNGCHGLFDPALKSNDLMGLVDGIEPCPLKFLPDVKGPMAYV